MSASFPEYVSPASTGNVHKMPVSEQDAICPEGYKKVLSGELYHAFTKSVLPEVTYIVYFMPYFDDVSESPKINRVSGRLNRIQRIMDIPSPYIMLEVVSSDYPGVLYESRNRPDFWVYVPIEVYTLIKTI